MDVHGPIERRQSPRLVTGHLSTAQAERHGAQSDGVSQEDPRVQWRHLDRRTCAGYMYLVRGEYHRARHCLSEFGRFDNHRESAIEVYEPRVERSAPHLSQYLLVGALLLPHCGQSPATGTAEVVDID